MKLLYHTSCLLAQENPLTYMGRNFREGGRNDALGELLILVGILAAVGLAIWAIAYFSGVQDQPGYNNPRRLFGQLCRAHQLDRRQRRLLRRLARAHQLKQPARLFLEPERFVAPLPRPLQASDRDGLQQLREKLFGQTRSAGAQT